MNDPRDERLDDELRGLLADAVSDVEPSDSLASLHHRTKVTPMNPRRPWLFAVGGAVVATAAVITAIALAGGGLAGRDTADPTPAQKEAELKRVRSRIDRIQKEINADIRKRDSLGAELKDAEQSVQSARRRLEEAREQRIESESQLRELERERARREGELVSERAALADLPRGAAPVAARSLA